MKLRRAMAVAAATAVIAPVALLSAPAAFATETPTAETSPSAEAPSATSSTPAAGESTPATAETAPATTSSSPSSPAATPSTPATSPSETAEEPDEEVPGFCEDDKIDVSIKGLPGKIAAGSGWHKFTLNVYNSSDATLTDLVYFAGASADKNGEKLFKSKKVQLQAYDPESKTWEDLSNPLGEAVGFVGYSDSLEPEFEVDLPLRINVKSSAPVGAGFSLGASIYTDADAQCDGFGEVSYKFQIVKAGTDTGGTEPQEGGKAPVPTEKPSSGTDTGAKVEGNLATTGSSSMLPTIGIAGGIAIVAGAGVVFAVKRRRSGDATA